MYTIKRGIPAPEIKLRGPKATSYPFADLARNDSFFVPIGEDKPTQVLMRVRAAAYRWRTGNGLEGTKFRITVHPDPDTGAESIGVWRTV